MQMLPSQSICSARRHLSSPLAQRVLHMERTADGRWLLALGGGCRAALGEGQALVRWASKGGKGLSQWGTTVR